MGVLSVLFVGSLVGWLVGWLVGCSVVWLLDWLITWLIDLPRWVLRVKDKPRSGNRFVSCFSFGFGIFIFTFLCVCFVSRSLRMACSRAERKIFSSCRRPSSIVSPGWLPRCLECRKMTLLVNVFFVGNGAKCVGGCFVCLFVCFCEIWCHRTPANHACLARGF